MINKHQKEYKETLEKTKVPLGKRPDWLKVKLPTLEITTGMYSVY